jgi:hypothetical protein
VLQGVLSKAIPWDLLIKQYGADEAYERELKKLIVSPEPVNLFITFSVIY